MKKIKNQIPYYRYLSENKHKIMIVNHLMLQNEEILKVFDYVDKDKFLEGYRESFSKMDLQVQDYVNNSENKELIIEADSNNLIPKIINRVVLDLSDNKSIAMLLDPSLIDFSRCFYETFSVGNHNFLCIAEIIFQDDIIGNHELGASKITDFQNSFNISNFNDYCETNQK